MTLFSFVAYAQTNEDSIDIVSTPSVENNSN